ncbi:MAG TPA: RNA polymerase sigma factor [Gemmataceae bacterium]|nr:RNA polymerase sigma factor [Gemmataceae bacterium]
MAQADDWSWERYRPLLKLQVRQLELDPRLQRRFDSSDLVQDTLFQAIKNVDQFKGRTEEERVAWLRKICRNKAIDRYREETARKGDVRRDQSIQAFEDSSDRWDRVLGNEDARPDHEAERREFLLRLAGAMEELSDDQRDAVLLIHLMRFKLSEAVEQMGRTEKSIAGLVRRGLEKLQALMPEFEPANP